MAWDNLLKLNILQHFYSWGQTQQECSHMLPKDLYVSNNTIPIAPNALVPVSSRLSKQMIVYAHDGLGSGNGNEQTSLICNIMHESYKQNAEWQKPDTTAFSQNPTDVNVKDTCSYDTVLEIRSSYSGKRCGRPERLDMCVSCFGCWLHGCGLRILIKSYSEVKWKWKWSCSVMSDFLWPMDCSSPGSSIHGIFQARILEWVAIYFSRGSSRPRDETRVSHIAGRHSNVWATREALMCNFYRAWVLSHFACVWLFATPWTFACQAPLSMGFSRQEYWSGLPCPPPGDLSDSEIKPTSLMSHALAGRFFTTGATWEVQLFVWYIQLWWFSH